MIPNEVTVDVLIIGGGPSGLATAIELANDLGRRGETRRIMVVEKGENIGSHILSGAVIRPAVFRDLLSEEDRQVIAGRSPRKLSGFGERSALLVIDNYLGAIGEDRPIPEQLDKYPGACGQFGAVRQWVTSGSETAG